MLDGNDGQTLASALAHLHEPDGTLALSAVPQLASLGARGYDLRIDMAASQHVGAPVVIVHRTPQPSTGLTPRQHQVALLAAEGLSNKDIARRLCLSPATVKDHLHAILRRLNLKRRGQIAAYLMRRP